MSIILEALENEPVFYKIGNKKINLNLIDENIYNFEIYFDDFNHQVELVATVVYEDCYGNHAVDMKQLAVLNENSEFLDFLKQKNEINGEKIKKDFFISLAHNCDNLNIDDGNLGLNDYNQLQIKKDAFIELCGYIDNAIDVDCGILALEKAFEITKEEYLKQKILMNKIDEKQEQNMKNRQESNEQFIF